MNIPVLSLLFVTVVWGATFPVLKIATAQLSGIETSALRFLLAALCMLPWALRAPRKAWRDALSKVPAADALASERIKHKLEALGES